MPNPDMTGWLQEKVGSVLENLARIADIAKDPETPDWYKRNLRTYVHPAFYNGLKALLWSHDQLDKWTPEAAMQPTEHGSLGLSALLTKLGVPHNVDTGTPATDLHDDEDDEPGRPDEPPGKVENPWATPLRQAAMTHLAYNVASPKLSPGEARLLGWIGYHVGRSEYPDTALIVRKCLYSDVGLSDAVGAVALQDLIDKGCVHVVRQLAEDTRIALRLGVPGLNDPRHEPPTH